MGSLKSSCPARFLCSIPCSVPSGRLVRVGHALLFAVGAGPPHDGVRKARRLNLFHDLGGVGLAGSRLSTRSPGPSSPRERSGSPFRANSLRFHLLRLRPDIVSRRAPCQSETRCCRSTCDAARRRACERRRRAPAPCLDAWRLSCPQARRDDHLLLRTSSVLAAA